MFSAQTAPATSGAGAISTDDMNAYQVGGGVLLIGTVGACTLGGTLVAPLPVLGGLAVGTGLVMFGDRLTKEEPELSDADKAAVARGKEENERIEARIRVNARREDELKAGTQVVA